MAAIMAPSRRATGTEVAAGNPLLPIENCPIQYSFRSALCEKLAEVLNEQGSPAVSSMTENTVLSSSTCSRRISPEKQGSPRGDSREKIINVQ
jgi:hypothetical protein